MNPKVSILVPIYNVSSYIERCAKSLFNQSFTDIEFIFVNDASPDDSVKKLQIIIDQFPKLSNQIKIIHHPINKGLAVARNTAIDASSGEYILVVDSDDYIEPEMVEKLYQKASNEKADIVVSDFFKEYNNRTEIFFDNVSESKEENFINIIIYNQVSPSLWNKLILRSLYLNSNCRVPDGLNYYEDRHVMTRLYYLANKIVKVNEAFYHYNQYNTTAISKTKEIMHFQNVIQFWSLFDEFLRKYNEFEKYEQLMVVPKVQSKVRLMIDTHSSQLRKEFASMFYEEETKCLKHFKRGEKLMLLLVRYRLFFLAQLFHNYLIMKNSIYRYFQISIS